MVHTIHIILLQLALAGRTIISSFASALHQTAKIDAFCELRDGYAKLPTKPHALTLRHAKVYVEQALILKNSHF